MWSRTYPIILTVHDLILNTLINLTLLISQSHTNQRKQISPCFSETKKNTIVKEMTKEKIERRWKERERDNSRQKSKTQLLNR